MMDVERWAIVPTARKQSIAEHQYFVMLYVIDLCKMTGMTPTGNLLTYASLHDADELHSGDIPSPYKSPEVKYGDQYTEHLKSLLTDSEISLVKLADLMESVVFLIEELKYGNYRAKKLLTKLSDRAKEHAKKFGLEGAVMKVFDDAADYEGRTD
jgi:5'-deoxynucleotidase YfbR-like HD superfamily hydrolase